MDALDGPNKVTVNIIKYSFLAVNLKGMTRYRTKLIT